MNVSENHFRIIFLVHWSQMQLLEVVKLLYLRYFQELRKECYHTWKLNWNLCLCSSRENAHSLHRWSFTCYISCKLYELCNSFLSPIPPFLHPAWFKLTVLYSLCVLSGRIVKPIFSLALLKSSRTWKNVPLSKKHL